MNSILVAPSILSADFSNLERDIKKINSADMVHIDVMDGVFVPNITIGAPVVSSLRKISDMIFDVHLMIVNPEKHIKSFVDAGADIITVHYETTRENTLNVINMIKQNGVKAGLSIKPGTSPEEIKEFFDYVDLILVMTVEPGFGGQRFMPDCAEKIKYIRKNVSKDVIIEVDGGINDITGKICVDFGANALVAGSYIYKNSDIPSAVNSLRY